MDHQFFSTYFNTPKHGAGERPLGRQMSAVDSFKQVQSRVLEKYQGMEQKLKQSQSNISSRSMTNEELRKQLNKFSVGIAHEQSKLSMAIPKEDQSSIENTRAEFMDTIEEKVSTKKKQDEASPQQSDSYDVKTEERTQSSHKRGAGSKWKPKNIEPIKGASISTLQTNLNTHEGSFPLISNKASKVGSQIFSGPNGAFRGSKYNPSSRFLKNKVKSER